MNKIIASCHCGDVKLEVSRKPRRLVECTCSVCRRYGCKWAYYTRKSVKVISPKDNMKAYLWGDKMIEFYHCKNCGCVTHYESTRKGPGDRIVVNARMMPAEAIADVPERLFDGADTWKYLE